MQGEEEVRAVRRQLSSGPVEACGGIVGEAREEGESCNRRDKAVDEDGSGVEGKGGTETIDPTQVEVSRPSGAVGVGMERQRAIVLALAHSHTNPTC